VSLTPIGQRLYDDLRPARELIESGLERATLAARGISGTLHVGFVGAPGGQLLAEAGTALRDRQEDFDLAIHEVQLVDAAPELLGGEVEVLLTCYPPRVDELVTGPALVREAQVLAVPSGHAYAAQETVAREDVEAAVELRTPDALAGRAAHRRSSPARPSVGPGPAVESLQEALTLVGAGVGVLPIGAHARRYHPRPDVVSVPFRHPPPVTWHLVWRAGRVTARVRAFTEAVGDVVHSGSADILLP
jgi:DNA-binding transcriptional LysR family regulator